MRELTEKALETCDKENVSYADIRVVTVTDEEITIKKGNVQTMNLSQIKGFGIRAIADGGLGFAGSYDLTRTDIERVAKLAAKIARASGSTRRNPIKFTDEAPVEDTYSTQVSLRLLL